MVLKAGHFALMVALEAASTDTYADSRDEAVLLFKKAQRHFAHQDFETAMHEFQESYAISPRPLLLFDMGLTANELGLRDEALSYLRRYMATVDHPDADSRVAKALIVELQRTTRSNKKATRPEPPVEPQVTPAPTAEGPTAPGEPVATTPAPPPAHEEPATTSASSSVAPLALTQTAETKPKPKRRAGLIAGLVVGGVLIVGGAVTVGLLFGLKTSPAATFGGGHFQ
jgi:hypothetical protein